MRKLFDTHCHLNIEPYIDNLDSYLSEINTIDILMNLVGTNWEDSKKAVTIASQYNNMYATIGIHPNDVDLYDESVIDQLEQLYLQNSKKIIAIGETGLDYHYEGYNQEKQMKFLQLHFNLAIKYQLTLVLHIRDAHNDAIAFLKQQTVLPRTIIHCFTGNMEDAKQYIELGCYLSFSGIITFKNAQELKEIAKIVPADKLLSETDAPFLTPVPFRGKTNLPSYVQYTNNELSILRKVPIDELEILLLENAKTCFKLK